MTEPNLRDELNRTEAEPLLPIEKFCQLMIARSLAWSICIFDPVVEMVTVPAATLPPVGSWFVAGSARTAWLERKAAPTASATRVGRSAADLRFFLCMTPPKFAGIVRRPNLHAHPISMGAAGTTEPDRSTLSTNGLAE